jgi:hypothetical protein
MNVETGNEAPQFNFGNICFEFSVQCISTGYYRKLAENLLINAPHQYIMYRGSNKYNSLKNYISCKLLGGPPCYPIGSLVEL